MEEFFAGITFMSVVYSIGGIITLCILWSLVFEPKWQVWASHQQGLADLQRSRNEQQIQVTTAQARLDAAQINKQAAIIEAEAVSAQIKEIGTQLTTHDLYLRWQWIKMMEEVGAEGTQTIYIPTEANLPILEASRRKA